MVEGSNAIGVNGLDSKGLDIISGNDKSSEEIPEMNTFKHKFLHDFNKGIVSEKFWNLLELAAEAEDNGFKVSGIFRNEVGEVFKGQLRHNSEWVLRSGRAKRLKDLYLCLIAASSGDLSDYATKIGNKGLIKIAEDCSSYGFNYMIRRRQENLFTARKIINGFAVLCPNGISVIDNDKDLISERLLSYVDKGFIQNSPSGNGRFHAFIKDDSHILYKFNLHYGFDVLGGNKQIFFQAVDKAGNFMYPYISGSLDNIGNISPQIEELFKVKYTYEEWYGKKDFALGAKPTDILTVAQNLDYLELKSNPDFWFETNSGERIYFYSAEQVEAFKNKLKKAEGQARRSLKFELMDYQESVTVGQTFKLFNDFKVPAAKEKYERKFHIGERNCCLFRYGRFLRTCGYNQATLNVLLEKANLEQCLEPLHDNEMRHLIKSVINLDNKKGFNQYVPLFSRKLVE